MSNGAVLHKEWRGETVLVSGASGDLGKEIVRSLGELGARVAAADLQQNELAVPGDRSRFDVVDVTNSAAVEDWVSSIEAGWGVPTAAVICAGRNIASRVSSTSDEDWLAVMDVNLNGAFYVARSVIQSMLAAHVAGRLVFVGSWAAHVPHPNLGAYSPSKAGLRALMKCLAVDHAADGILINEVAPGIVDAGLSQDLFQANPSFARRTRDSIPVRQCLQPCDVARDVLFLASPSNTNTTGSVLITDGGLGLTSSMSMNLSSDMLDSQKAGK